MAGVTRIRVDIPGADKSQPFGTMLAFHQQPTEDTKELNFGGIPMKLNWKRGYGSVVSVLVGSAEIAERLPGFARFPER